MRRHRMIISTFKRKVIPIIIGILFISGCAREAVIARVNGEPILKRDLNNVLRRSGIKVDLKTEKGEDAHRAMYPNLVEQLIDERIVLQAARKEKIKVDRKEVQKSYNDSIKTFNKEADYIKHLKEKGLTKIMVLKFMEKDLTIEKFKEHLAKDLDIPDKELRDYYEGHIQTFETPEQVRLAFIKTDNPVHAKRIKKELEHGANFEEVASKYPAGHAERGGESGWVTLNTFPSDMVREIRKIKTGHFEGPIKGREGYYIIKVQDRREKSVKPFDEVKDNIKHTLLLVKKEDKYQNWLQDAKKNAKIEVLLEKK
jgi:foldase protein PrsA